MPYTTYTPFADAAQDRRHRRPAQAVAGHPDIPVYERHADVLHGVGHGVGHAAAGHAADAGDRGGAMGLALRMDATGLWVIRLGGELAELGGRCYWDSLDTLQAAAKRAGIPLSDFTIHTGRNA